MGQFSLTHLLLLGILLLIFFGPSKLPQLGQSLGKAIRGFKEGLNEIDAEAREVQNPTRQATGPQKSQLPPSQTQDLTAQSESQPEKSKHES